MIWARSQEIEATAGTGAVDLLEDFRALNGGATPLGTTVTRVRGAIQGLLGAAPAGPAAGLLWGLLVHPSTATAAEVPAPNVDSQVDWMTWQFIPSSWGGGGATQRFSWEVDVKSQRKMEELQETLWLSYVWQPGLATGELAWDLSTLLKLP